MRHCAATAWEGDRLRTQVLLISPETGLKREPTGFLSPDVAVGDGMVGNAAGPQAPPTRLPLSPKR